MAALCGAAICSVCGGGRLLRTLWIAVVCLVLLLGAVIMYPVGGVVWRASQVERLALVRGDLRSESVSRVAIGEVVLSARVDRIRRVLGRAPGGKECIPQDLELRAGSRWVPVRIHCPSGFFLDYLPRPGM